MNKLFIILAGVAVLLFHSSPVKGATVITATITVTNTPGVGSNWVVNGNSRTFTNAQGSPVASWITIGTGAGGSASNIYRHILANPYSSPSLIPAFSSTNVITLIGTAMVITTNNYFSVSYVTNSGTELSTVQVPFENVTGATNRTNNAHWLVDAFNRYVYTNSFATNANVVSNLFGLGARPYQEVLGNVGFRGRTAVNSNFFATNGFTKNLTNIDVVSSNGVNFGGAFRSEGAGVNSFQAGSNAVAAGNFDTSIGNNTVTSNGYNFASGSSATATNGNGTAVGSFSRASRLAFAGGNGTISDGEASVTLGQAAENYATNSVLIAPEQVQTADAYGSYGFGGASWAPFGLVLGMNAFNAYSNSAAIGPPDHLGGTVASTKTNQIRIGTANNTISAPGLYESPRSTNSQFAGTNIMRGSYSFPRFDVTTLQGGANNPAVPFGTNRYIRLTGLASGSSIPTITGIIGGATTGGTDGQDIRVFVDTGYGVVFSVSTTADPVPANRINSTPGSDVFVADQGWADLCYDVTDSRWKIVKTSEANSFAANTVSGAGSGSTNYTLIATTPKQYLGSSNVNISAVMGYTAGVVNEWSTTITNLSGNVWGIGFSSVTNRWLFNGPGGTTNSPSVLTNGTRLKLEGESEGTNVTVRYHYFTPGA